MKIIAVIPARYKSTRLPGKPLKDICGKPMLWWVWNEVKKVKLFDEVVVATDNDIIVKACEKFDMNVLMTSELHDTPTSRLYEISTKKEADYYVFIGGDEPLIEAIAIEKVVSAAINKKEDVIQAITKIKTAPEVIDFTNIKIVVNTDNYILYSSRSPLPYPKGGLNFDYYKFVGITVYSKDALNFYNNQQKTLLEKIEECDLLRFIERLKKVLAVEVNYYDVSVDTQKDLDFVIGLMKEKNSK